MLRPGFRGLAGLVALAGCWLSAGLAHAQSPAPMSSACPAGNLLEGRRPWQWQDLRGNPTLVTDGAVGPEGALWDSPVAMVFDTAAGSVTYDLGQPTPIAAIYVQADANDTYKVLGSLDGTPGSYKLVVEIENVRDRGHGLRGRAVQIPPMLARYLRVGEGNGDDAYSVSEFAAYCQVPVPFPPVMRQVSAPIATVAERPWYMFDWWDDKPSARLEMGIAFFALALLMWTWWAGKTGKEVPSGAWFPPLVSGASLVVTVAIFIAAGPNTWPWWVRCALGIGTWGGGLFVKGVRDRLLILVGILSFFAYFNFMRFHFGNYVHYWDTYHYYVGSKYFNELEYDRLYDCASVADSEDPALRRRVELRKIMNLRTNVLGSTTEILAHPERCKDHFTPARWESFKKDIEFFRLHHGVKRWEEAQTDHGYNATPVWNIVGTTLANMAPASESQIKALTAIDPAFIVAMVLTIWWAFGWRTLCVALAVFGTNFPSRFYWTGGAYLRWDWLFYMTAGVCLIKKQKPIVGGYFVAYSGLLRVFPGFLFAGPLFVIVQQLLDQTKGRPWWKRLPPRELPAMIRRVDRGHLGVVLGGALAVATLVPLSFVTSNGPGAYRLFVKNSEKHTSTALTNYMGWRTVMSYKDSEQSRYLRTDRLEDPWKDWKDARLRTFRHRKWLYVVGVLAFAALLYRAVRGFAAWEAAALSALMIAVVPELTCYYYSFLIVMALLWWKREEVGITLLAVTAATGFIDLAPTQYLPNTFPWTHLQMPTWLAEQYTAMSAATLLGMGYILYEFGFVARTETVAAVAGGAEGTAKSAAGTKAVAAVSASAATAATESPAKSSSGNKPAHQKKPQRRKNRR